MTEMHTWGAGTDLDLLPPGLRLLEVRCYARSRRGELLGVVTSSVDFAPVRGAGGLRVFHTREAEESSPGLLWVACRCGGHAITLARVFEVQMLKASRPRRDRVVDVRSVVHAIPSV